MTENKVTLDQVPGIRTGQVSWPEALTGCTVALFPDGAVAGHAACGVASGSRELAAFSPRHLVERVHGICLSGGSAFGLAAASGVARVLEAQGIGHTTSFGRVPIVAGAVVYDLNLGDANTRPDEAAGAQAAQNALAGEGCTSGNQGAGTGVCAGKLLGVGCATKTGQGQAGVRLEDGALLAALVVTNPVGDVLHPRSGQIVAGARRAPDSLQLVGTADVVRAGARCEPLTSSNTTLAVVGTDVALTRVEAAWVAEQAAVALARSLDPPFTRHDGDVVFCVSTGERSCDLHRVGVLARDALGAALVDSCLAASAAGGLPCARDGLLPPTPNA